MSPPARRSLTAPLETEMQMASAKTQIDTILRILQYALIGCGSLQFIIELSSENIIATALATIASWIAIEYIRRTKSYILYPVSTLALLGLTITSSAASVLTQALYWTPLVYLLRTPELTFTILATVQLFACATHWVYIKFEPFRKIPTVIGENIFKPIGLYRAPSVYTLWIMGLIGLYAQLSGHSDFGDVSGKALQAFGFMAWMPLLILYFRATHGESYCNNRTQLILILLFLLALFAIGAARNVRQIMFTGPLQIAITYILYSATHSLIITRRAKLQLVAGALAGGIGVVLAADLATAMVIAREKRLSSTGTEMIAETFQILTTDRYRITQYREQFELAAITRLYDEAYIENPVLARFSSTKFHDNMLYLGSSFENENIEDLFYATGKRIFNLLPEPIAKMIDPDFDKADFFFSMGDYYLYQIQGPQGLSSFIVGSIWADVYYMFGIWSPVFLFFMLLATMVALDALSTQRGAIVALSPIAFCTAVHIFLYGYGIESIATHFAFLARNLPQSIVLYLIVLHALDLTYKTLKLDRAVSKA